MLADDQWKVPGALSAIKYFHRIQKNYSGKPMLVIKAFSKEQTTGDDTFLDVDQEIVVFVDGHKRVFSSTILKIISEEKD